MSEAVLFLDIDGVLNDESVFRDKRFGPFPINHESVMRLHDVIRQTGAWIVLSSSWREMPRLERKLSSEFVFEIYPENAMSSIWVRHEDGSTKRLSGDAYECRGSEIAEWLARHPEVTRYAIVDDESDMLDDQKPFFVKTSFETGFDDQAASALAAILGPTPSEIGWRQRQGGSEA